MQEAIKIFGNKDIRTVWDEEQQEWYFCVADVVVALTDSKNPANYLKTLRKRDAELAEGWLQIVTPLYVETSGGKQRMNYASRDGISRILQSMPSSSKMEEFKKWLDQVTTDSEIIEDAQISDFEKLNGEIVLYQPDETVRLEVHLEGETVWLTQAQIIDLFQSSKANISEHISNIYEQGELVYEATVRNFRTVQKEGNRMVNRASFKDLGKRLFAFELMGIDKTIILSQL